MGDDKWFDRVRSRLFVGGHFHGRHLTVVDESAVELESPSGMQSYHRRVLRKDDSPYVVLALTSLTAAHAQELLDELLREEQ